MLILDGNLDAYLNVGRISLGYSEVVVAEDAAREKGRSNEVL